MHKIKRAAHRSSWINSDDGSESRTYNFFGRFTPRRPRVGTDLERGSQSRALSPLADELSNHPRAPVGSPLAEKLTEFHHDDRQPVPPANGSARDVPSQQQQPRARGGILGRFKKHDPDDAGDGEQDDKKKHSKRIKHFDTSHITFWSQFKVVFGSWINILLVCVPAGIALGNISSVNGVVVFVINFIAIVPLAAMLSFGTEELAMYIGEVMGGLLNASFGNATELIVAIIALVKHETTIVQTSLLGSMLSNLLLVLGMCFFCGGINRPEQNFNLTVANTAASLLSLAIGSLIIPTAFSIFAPDNFRNTGLIASGFTQLSRGTAVLLLIVYACYLFFQLRTHREMYNKPSDKVPKRSTGKKDPGEAIKGIAMVGAASGATSAGGDINQKNFDSVQENGQDDDDEEESPQLTILGALATLVISTVFIALCAEYMVDGIGAVSQSVSQEFIGLILLPIVGNAAEHATAVTVAIKDKMDLAIGVAIGSSLQIALLVLPLMIMLNWWGVGSPSDLTLNFDGFLVVVLVISIWLVNYLIADGKSHWLEGVLLMITYFIIAVAAWFYPTTENLAG